MAKRIATGGSVNKLPATLRGRGGKVNIKRLFVRDPYNVLSSAGQGFGLNPTVATFSEESEQLTSNPNPAFDPSKAPGAVAVVQRAPKPKGADKGHQKAFKPNVFTLFGGKTLRRR
jgi:hypothetical protein